MRIMTLAEWKVTAMAERLSGATFGHQPARVTHLGVVLVAWDPVAAVESADLVLERLRRLRGVRWSMVIVVNNDHARQALCNVDRDCKIVAGSNREAEFSAYEEGRQILMEEAGSKPDVWMILNDRLSFYKADCVWAATPALLQFASSVPIAVGTVDFLPRYFKLRGQKFRCYVRSNYVLVSSGALDRIGSLCTVTADEYALAVPLALGAEDSPLSGWLGGDLGEYLRDFLTVPGPQGWMRAEPLTAASWPMLRKKALSIVNEWLLSLRLIEAEVPIIPWRLARAMSGLDAKAPFSHRLLNEYRGDPGFGGGLEGTPIGRIQLAAAVLAGRAGADKMAETFLSSAAGSSAAARAVEHTLTN